MEQAEISLRRIEASRELSAVVSVRGDDAMAEARVIDAAIGREIR